MAKKREVWDAVDENGELLGFDLYRDEWGKSPYRRVRTTVWWRFSPLQSRARFCARSATRKSGFSR